jgi:hypothetical protein
LQSAQKGRKRRASGVVYKVVVRTDERKNAGTDANVCTYHSSLPSASSLITPLSNKPQPL